MALKSSFKQEKSFYSIGEVAEMINVKQSLLRYWEKEFDTIQPDKTPQGTRRYRKEDVEEIKLIHHLVKDKGLTIDGAKKKLKENREGTIKTEKIVNKLKDIRAELILLKNEFDELEPTFPNLNSEDNLL